MALGDFSGDTTSTVFNAASRVYEGGSQLLGNMYENGGKGFETGMEVFIGACASVLALGISSKLTGGGFTGGLITLAAGTAAFFGAGEMMREFHNNRRAPTRTATQNVPVIDRSTAA